MYKKEVVTHGPEVGNGDGPPLEDVTDDPAVGPAYGKPSERPATGQLSWSPLAPGTQEPVNDATVKEMSYTCTFTATACQNVCCDTAGFNCVQDMSSTTQ